MLLTECSHCGSHVRADGSACPTCGHQDEPICSGNCDRTPARFARTFSAALIGVAMAACYGAPQNYYVPADPTDELESNDEFEESSEPGEEAVGEPTNEDETTP